MPIRFNPPAPEAMAFARPRHDATTVATSATLQPPVQDLRSSCLPGPLSALQLFATCLRDLRQSTSSRRSADACKKSLDVALDRWAASQDAPDIHHVLEGLKRTVHFATSPSTRMEKQRNHELNFSRQQLSNFPGEMGQAKALHRLNLSGNKLTEFPPEMGQVKSLETLDLSGNQLTSFPSQMGEAKALESLDLSNNQLASFPAEMGQAAALRWLRLNDNRLTSFPPEMGQAGALQSLYLINNQLISFPGEMAQAKALRTLNLSQNRLTELPGEMAELSQLRYLFLDHNLFTRVPRFLLDLPAGTEIDLRNNPLPEAEIDAVREEMAQRRAAGQTVPQLLLPGLAAELGELREAAANDMNVHTTVLTDAFKRRLNDVASQFPAQLCGTSRSQRAELNAIALRLTQALDAHATAEALNPRVLAHARNVAALMFKKSQGKAAEYHNEFDRSTGHVLGYTFLALEAQWSRTPETHRVEARRNGMAALITALANGHTNCDTRLCEEVMQTIGLPLTYHAEVHAEVTGVEAPSIGATETRDLTIAVAKQVLLEMMEINPAPTEAPPQAWRTTVVEIMQRDHGRVPPEQWEPFLNEIESMWETFQELVEEQRSAKP